MYLIYNLYLSYLKNEDKLTYSIYNEFLFGTLYTYFTCT